MGDWCTIESDPGVFSELIRGIGVKGVQVEEVYSLEDAQLIESIKPIYGLVFLFKWTNKIEKRECLLDYDADLFFANQVIQNACATQALLAILLNREDQIDVGEELRNFKSFTAGMDPQMKGLSISNQESIQKVHNSFARPEPFQFVQKKRAATEEDDVFHFVSFVPFKNKLYELDGVQKGPVLIGSFEGDDWLPLATHEISQRILKYSQDEVRFNLLALTIDKRFHGRNTIKQLEAMKYQLYQLIKDGDIELNESELAEIASLEQSLSEADKAAGAARIIDITKENAREQIEDVKAQITHQNMLLADEEDKFKHYERENVRRRNNYLPFIIELFRQTARKGLLQGLVDKAKTKKKEKLQQQQQSKQQKPV